MKRHGESLQAYALSVLALLGAACSSSDEREEEEPVARAVTLAEMPAPARAAAERLIGGGRVERIDEETEDGRLIYDVEATVDGEHVEYTLLADGTVVGTETAIEFVELPEPVRAAALTFFGGSVGLRSALVEENGRTLYELEGKKFGRLVEATFDPSGTVVEEK
jgi:uncharacterized membrane protein YkoI